jgi:hypothetical protein
MINLLTLEQFNCESINEGSEKQIRSFYISQKHDGIEVGDAILITAKKFKKTEKYIKELCKDILNESKTN